MNDERNWDGGQDDSGHQPPRYEHYQFHEEHKETLITPGPSEHKKNQNSFQKKVGTTVALAVIFGLVASVVFQALNFTAVRGYIIPSSLSLWNDKPGFPGTTRKWKLRDNSRLLSCRCTDLG